MSKKCIIVNLMGGPGVGKSILASEVWSKLKRMGVTSEVSWEYIKRKLREKAEKAVANQIYLFGKQQFLLFTLKDEVDVIVTDAPLLLFTYYDKTKCKFLKDIVINEYNKYNNLMYFIDRDLTAVYETEGRYQNLEEAKIVDAEMKQMLFDNNIEFKALTGIGEATLDTIMSDILKKINENNEIKH